MCFVPHCAARAHGLKRVLIWVFVSMCCMCSLHEKGFAMGRRLSTRMCHVLLCACAGVHFIAWVARRNIEVAVGADGIDADRDSVSADGGDARGGYEEDDDDHH